MQLACRRPRVRWLAVTHIVVAHVRQRAIAPSVQRLPALHHSTTLWQRCVRVRGSVNSVHPCRIFACMFLLHSLCQVRALHASLVGRARACGAPCERALTWPTTVHMSRLIDSQRCVLGCSDSAAWAMSVFMWHGWLSTHACMHGPGASSMSCAHAISHAIMHFEDHIT
jgi:hypothetical protein